MIDRTCPDVGVAIVVVVDPDLPSVATIAATREVVVVLAGAMARKLSPPTHEHRFDMAPPERFDLDVRPKREPRQIGNTTPRSPKMRFRKGRYA